MCQQRPHPQSTAKFSTIFRILAGMTFCIMLLAAHSRAIAQENDLKQVASSLARDINTAGRHTVTVADFTDLQGNVTELGRFIAEELSTQLVIDAKSFTVVERIQLAAILKEHQISISGLVDPATVRKLGQFAGVDALVTGTLVPFSDSVRLTAKVLDVNTAKVLTVSTADLPRTKAIDDLLSRGIASPSTGGSNAANSGAPSPTQSPTISSQQQNEFLVTMKACALQGDRTVCAGSVTNKAVRSRLFGINGYGTSAVDSNGNSAAANQWNLGPQGAQTDLMPDLPMNFYITFPGGDATAAKISVIFAYYTENNSQSKLLFRNLPLTRK